MAIKINLNFKWEKCLNAKMAKPEMFINKIKRKFNLPKELSVNYSHATHAKLSDILDAISELDASDEQKETKCK